MADNGLKALEAELGAAPPPGLAQLTESQLTELATAVRDARHRQAAQLATAADLRALREQITDALFSAHGHALGRLAAASKLLPIRVVSAIGERVFGPVLAARIAGLLEPDRVVEMASTMPIPFLADVAIKLDPRRASVVLSRIPSQRVAEITCSRRRTASSTSSGCSPSSGSTG